MNILQVISSSKTSGAEKHMVVLSEWLQKLGHNVLVVCPPGEWLHEQLREVPDVTAHQRHRVADGDAV